MKLGKNQARLLRALTEHQGRWYPGCGWVWGNDSQTDRILASLVRRGLVERYGESMMGYGKYCLPGTRAKSEIYKGIKDRADREERR